ncbi:MAG: metal-dependent transcriptional regulator [Flavobacteriales bacterium]|nr:metal-dependent transcriptional regulator [Flavobacteriales bacterium]MCB9447977.1 metal-dependent transcriptional regulator [Flavobacteriales bacterium]
MYTSAEENYLKAIWSLGQGTRKGISTNAIAAKLNTKAASVTDMLKRLSEKGLVAYEKYKGVKLTREGTKTALRITRKHRLWEVFLVEKLEFGWHEVHIIAEQLEHVKSPELIERLDAYLGHPRFDPHGDPIPDADGKLHPHEAMVALDEAPDGKSLEIIGVSDSSDDFLKHLEKLGLVLGTRLVIRERHGYDRSITIELGKKNQTVITNRTAQNLMVRPASAPKNPGT